MPKGQKDKNVKVKEAAEPYPKKVGKPNGDSQEESLFCDRCTSAVDQLIQCEKCEMYLCAVCEKIPESVMKIVGDYNQIHWFCQQCDTLISKIIGQACTIESLSNSVQSSVSSCLKDVAGQFTELVNQTKECLKPIIALKEDLSPMETNNHSEDSQQHNTNIPQNCVEGTTSISTALSSVLAEEKERSKRQLNLILHNLEEASEDDAEARKHQDIKKATDVFRYLGVKATVHNALRLGKKGNKNRLLKVTVNSDKEKAAVLRSCTRLRHESTPSNFRKIYITPDLTPQQQKENKVLRSKLADMNKDGNFYRIKNGLIVRREK